MINVDSLWQDMLTKLEGGANSALAFDVWLKALQPVEVVDNRLILLAPDEEHRVTVLSRYRALLKEVLKQQNPLLSEVDIIVRAEYQRLQVRDAAPSPVAAPAPRVEEVSLIPRYSFENFVVGSSNQFVFAAASAIAEEPGKRYNPLFIYGGVGLGKTHVMHAIGNQIRLLYPHLRVLYVTSEKFTNDFIEGIRAGSSVSNSFRERYRNIDVLMVDDVQFFSGKEGTQEEFFHTFNALYQMGKQIVLTSDRPPKEINQLEDRLRSRFEGGIIADIQPPDLETRIAIFQKKVLLGGYRVPLEVVVYMAEHIDNNVREMESLLSKVVFMSKLSSKEPSIEIAREALKDYEQRGEGDITPDRIIEVVCGYFKIGRDDVLSKKKTKEIVETRQICIYLITEMLPLPLVAIGNIFGGRDHTTIMHSRNKVAERLKQNIKLKIVIQDIKDMLRK